MLKDVLIDKDEVPVFLCNNIVVRRNGTIYSSDTELDFYTDEDGELCLDTKLGDLYGVYKVSHLVCHTYKPTHVPVSQWDKLKVLFVNSDRNDFNPSNLIWMFTNLKSERYPGYAHIPGFSRYVINEQANCLDTLTGNPRNVYVKGGYLWFSVYPDNSKIPLTLGQHRALCFAFKEYTADVDDLNVNHKDGIKDRNVLDNLEWVTRSGNMIHALENDLNNRKNRTLAKNVVTGQILAFRSVSNCAVYFGVTPDTMSERIRQPGQKVYDGKFMFKYLDDETPWREVTDLKKEVIRSGYLRPVKSLNITTGEVAEHKSISHAARYLNVNFGSLKAYFRLRPQSSYRGIKLKDIYDTTPWF